MISFADISMETARSWATSTATTLSRVRATSTPACMSRSCRPASYTSSGCAPECDSWQTSSVRSTWGELAAAMVSGAFGKSRVPGRAALDLLRRWRHLSGPEATHRGPVPRRLPSARGTAPWSAG